MSSSTRRAAVLAAVTMACVATAASPASAARAPKVYGGVTADGNPFGLTLDGAGKRLRTIGLFATGDCNGYIAFGEQARAVAQMPAAPAADDDVFDHATVSNGRFSVAAQVVTSFGSFGGKVTQRIVGRVKRNAASGTLAVDIEMTDPGTGQAVGTCSMPEVRWTAKRSPKRIYTGATSDDWPVVVTLNSARSNVRSFRVAWGAACDVGGDFSIGEKVINFPVRRGRFGDDFSYTADLDDGTRRTFTYDLAGRVGATRATGTITAGITEAGGPIGKDRCGPRTLSWRTISS